MLEDNSIISSVVSNYNNKEISTMSIETDHIEEKIKESVFDEISTAKNDVSENGTPADVEMIPSFLQAAIKADPELASDAKKKMDAENEKRINTLRENGAKGGRPRIDRGGLAKMCLDAVFTKDGQCLLCHYRGNWFQYKDGCYSTIPEEDIDKKVTGYLIRSGAEVVSSAIRRDILGNLKSDELCGLTVDKHTMPCFISTGEPAWGVVSMKNGIINIDEIVNAMEKGLPLPAIRPHTPDLFTTVRVSYAYDPTATCPKFETYLEGVQPKAENREMLQMLAGLLLTSDMSYNVAFFIYGESGTGKTVFMDVLESLIGEANCCCVPLAFFAEKFGTADLTEKKANLCDEAPVIPENGKFGDIESVFKAVTNGRPINVQRKGVEPWTARATAHCVFTSNNLPILTDRSNGLWERMRIITFNVKIRGTDRQDQHLIDKLKEEMPGILNWALRGLVKLHALTSHQQEKKTFPQCDEGAVLLAKMREDSDREQKFLREETKAATPDKFLGALNMYDTYKKWILDRGYYPVGYDKFRDAVLRVYPNIASGRKTIRGRKDTVFYGIEWFTDYPEFTTAPTPIASSVQFEQGGASHEFEGQPDLGF